jgi:molybdopterin converting factor small subunit
MVDLVFWAGAKAVAGTDVETWQVHSIGAALQAAAERRRDPRFDRLLVVCTVLVDGVVVRSERLGDPLEGVVRAEILPPFAGGAA